MWMILNLSVLLEWLCASKATSEPWTNKFWIILQQKCSLFFLAEQHKHNTLSDAPNIITWNYDRIDQHPVMLKYLIYYLVTYFDRQNLKGEPLHSDTKPTSESSKDTHPVHWLQHHGFLLYKHIRTEFWCMHKQTLTLWEAMQTKRDFPNDPNAVN